MWEVDFLRRSFHLRHTPHAQNWSSWFANTRQRRNLKHWNLPISSLNTRVLKCVWPHKSTFPFQTLHSYTRSVIPATNKTATLCTAQENKKQNSAVNVKIHLDIGEVQVWPLVSLITLIKRTCKHKCFLEWSKLTLYRLTRCEILTLHFPMPPRHTGRRGGGGRDTRHDAPHTLQADCPCYPCYVTASETVTWVSVYKMHWECPGVVFPPEDKPISVVCSVQTQHPGVRSVARREGGLLRHHGL